MTRVVAVGAAAFAVSGGVVESTGALAPAGLGLVLWPTLRRGSL